MRPKNRSTTAAAKEMKNVVRSDAATRGSEAIA